MFTYFIFLSKSRTRIQYVCRFTFLERIHCMSYVKLARTRLLHALLVNIFPKRNMTVVLLLVLSLSVLNLSSSSVFLLSYSILPSIVRINITQNNENFTYHEIIHLMSCYSKIIWKEIKNEPNIKRNNVYFFCDYINMKVRSS